LEAHPLSIHAPQSAARHPAMVWSDVASFGGAVIHHGGVTHF
jgi:hypothetical protein